MTQATYLKHDELYFGHILKPVVRASTPRSRANGGVALFECVAYALCALTALNARTALAQAEKQSVDLLKNSPRQISASEFAQYSPQTALDVIRLVPGFIVREVEGRRGIGTNETNILLNGRRITGKLDDVEATLSRIPFADIVKVEVGSAAAFNIAGLAGDAANVVTETNDFSGQFSWEPEYRARLTDPVLLDGSVSLSGKTGEFEFTVGFQNASVRDGAAGPELVFFANGSLFDRREEVIELDLDRPRLSGSIHYKGANRHSGNISAAVVRSYFDFEERSVRQVNTPDEQTRILAQRQRERSWELSADYKFPFAGGLFQLIGEHREERLPITTSVLTANSDVLSSTGSIFDETRKERQTTLRAEQQFGGTTGDWLIASEYGRNRFQSEALLAQIDADGVRTEMPLIGGGGAIEEERLQSTLSYSGNLSKTIEVQLTVGTEVSWLQQSGNLASARRFFRPKGVAAVNWQAGKKLKIFAQVERRVGQIEFLDFLASVNLTEGQQTFANPDLEPPQSWDFEIGTTREFSDLTRATLRLYARDISDLVDKIPLTEFGDAIGNIESAFLYGVELNGTVDLSGVGIHGARLDARFQLQESDLTDPVTGLKRRISNNLRHLVDMSFRHDISQSNWAWGMGVDYERRAADFRFDEFTVFRQGATSSAFIENKDVAGLRFRASAEQALGYFQQVDRTRFQARRGGPLEFVERRQRERGPIFRLSVSGTF